MKKIKLNLGWVLTILWFLGIGYFFIFGDLKKPNSFNELGDALAGIVAPIAFLWLILGYVQQGKQLEQNTKALEQQEKALNLQIAEMKESVKQQKELVSQQKEKLTRQSKAAKPIFDISIENFEQYKNHNELIYQFEISCTNIGAEVSDFIVMSDCSEEILFGANIFQRGNTLKKLNLIPMSI